MGDAALQALQIAATSLMNLGLALMLGALACAWLQRGGAAPAPHRIGRMAWALRAGTAVALLGAVMALWAESALMADVPLAEAGSTLTAVIGESHYGHAWVLGVLALGMIAAAAWRRGVMASPTRLGAAAAGIAFFAGFRSATSHAAAAGWLPMVVEWSHAMLVSLWAGEVFLAAWLMPDLDGSSPAPARHACADFIARLSASATWTLAGVFLTGAIGAWRGLDGPPGAWLSSGYAAVLAVKLVFVAAAAALGGFNRFVVMPGLLPALHAPQASASASPRRFRRVLRIEACALFAALVAAAVLATSAPPPATRTAAPSRRGHPASVLDFAISRLASAAAAARVSTPSFSNTCSRCLFTVRGLMPRISPMSRLVLPLAIHESTSVSRRVSAARSSRDGACASTVCNCSSSMYSPMPTGPRLRATSARPPCA